MYIYIYVYTGPTRGLSGFCIRGDYLWPLHPCVSSRGTRVCKDVCVWLCARVAKSFAGLGSLLSLGGALGAPLFVMQVRT